jgi:2-aminoadipate transaminase
MNFERHYSSTARRLQPSIIRALLKLVQSPGIISLAGGTPDSNLFDLDLYARLAEQAARGQGRLSLQYGETQGWLPLREQVAAYMAGRGVALGPDQVLITTGSQQGIDLLARLFLDAGDCVAMEEPGYLGAITAFRAFGAQILPLPLRGAEGLDPAEAEAALAAHKGPQPKLLYLTPTYQNPTGATLTPERRAKIAELAARHGMLLVEDDPYGEISFDGPPPKPLMAYDGGGNTVFLGSFSKMSVPGLRVGWLAGPAALVQKLVVAKESADVCSSVLAQSIAALFLEGGHLKTTLPRLISAYHARRDALAGALRQHLPQGAQLRVPAGGFFLWADLAPGVDTQACFQEAIDAGVAYVPGAVFHSTEGAGRNTLRLSFCAVEEAKLLLGAERLGKILRSQLARA